MDQSKELVKHSNQVSEMMNLMKPVKNRNSKERERMRNMADELNDS